MVLFRLTLDLVTFSALFLLVYGRFLDPPLSRIRRILRAALRSGRLEEEPGSSGSPSPGAGEGEGSMPRPLAGLSLAFVLLLDIYLQGAVGAYCAGRTLHALAEGTTPRWLAYSVAFLAAEAPLGVLARRVEGITATESFRSIIPMGLFVAFCVRPDWQRAYFWLAWLLNR
jgi:hypothetical protein